MFSSFFRKKGAQANSDSDDNNHDEDDEDFQQSLEFQAEVGGGKGWPSDVTCIMFHETQGLICAGTEGGAIYVYGDGFQYMRPWLTDDSNEVTSIVPLYPSRILVSYSDNGIVVMDLPTLDVVDLLTPTWLGDSNGDITNIYVDYGGQKNFVYIGTSEGIIIILDVTEQYIRLCEYDIKPMQDLGFKSSITVSALSICPKEEKYIAIGVEGALSNTGNIIIFDMLKKKVHRQYDTPAITTLTWDHTGDVLYAGTRTGEILSTSLDKTHHSSTWNAALEVVEGYEDDEDPLSSVIIRSIRWLAPQPQSPSEGCLFVLLASRGPDNDNLRRVLVGLAPSTAQTAGLEAVFSLTPIPGQKFVNFAIVPTFDKYEQGRKSTSTSQVTPGILLLAQRPDEDDPSHFSRQLKIVRCPKGPVKDWALEIGDFPVPRKAREVLPSISKIKCMTGIACRTPAQRTALSLSKALLTLGQDGDQGKISSDAPIVPRGATDSVSTPPPRALSGKQRRCSFRAFEEHNMGLLERGMLQLGKEQHHQWEMVLASGGQEATRQGQENEWRRQDIVVKGHDDGTLIVWGVSVPQSGRELGLGNVWLPLSALRVGGVSVTSLRVEEDTGLMAAGDEAGEFVLWEIFEQGTGMGAIDVLRSSKDETHAAASFVAHTSENSESTPADDGSRNEKYTLYGGYKFNALRETIRVNLGSKITTIMVLPSFQMIFVGTENGEVHVCKDWKSKEFVTIQHLEEIGAQGFISALTFSSYQLASGSIIAAVYVVFSDGHVAIVDAISLSVLAFSPGKQMDQDGEDEEEEHSANYDTVTSDVKVLNGSMTPIAAPQLREVAKALAIKSIELEKKQSESSISSSPNSPTAQPSPVNAAKGTPKKSFFGFQRTAKPPVVDKNAEEEKKLTPIKASSLDDPNRPRHLIFSRGKYFFNYDLSKFSSFSSKGSATLSAATAAIMGVSAYKMSARPVVASRILHCHFKTEDEGREEEEEGEEPRGQSIVLICFLTTKGTAIMYSISQKKGLCHTSLLEGVVDDLPQLDDALILDNGHFFMSRRGWMIYSCTQSCPQLRLPRLLPDPSSASSDPPVSSFCLLSGREDTIRQQKETMKKRRSSVIKLTSGPTDLKKIFAKSREEMQKEDLFGESVSTLRESTIDEDQDTSMSRATSVNNRVMSEMAQTKEALEQRGDRIERLARKMDDFKESAHEYRENVRKQTKELRQKNATWGMF